MAAGTLLHLHPPGSGNPQQPASAHSTVPAYGAVLTVFSLSARVSRFSGDNCSCCWSAMVASGVRTESMANESERAAAETTRDRRNSWNPVHRRLPASAPFKRLPYRARAEGRGLGSHWTRPAPLAAPRGRFELRRRFSAQRPLRRLRRPGARALAGPEPAGIAKVSEIESTRGRRAGVAAEVGVKGGATPLASGTRRLDCRCVPCLGVRGTRVS